MGLSEGFGIKGSSSGCVLMAYVRCYHDDYLSSPVRIILHCEGGHNGIRAISKRRLLFFLKASQDSRYERMSGYLLFLNGSFRMCMWRCVCDSVYVCECVCV